MDTGEGKFVRYETERELNDLKSTYPKNKSIFEVGEQLEIRDNLFLIKDISMFGMTLKLLSRPLKKKDFFKVGWKFKIKESNFIIKDKSIFGIKLKLLKGK